MTYIITSQSVHFPERALMTRLALLTDNLLASLAQFNHSIMLASELNTQTGTICPSLALFAFSRSALW